MSSTPTEEGSEAAGDDKLASIAGQLGFGCLLLSGGVLAVAGVYDGLYFYGSPALPVKWPIAVVGTVVGAVFLITTVRSAGLRNMPVILVKCAKRYKVAFGVLVVLALILLGAGYAEYSRRQYMEEHRDEFGPIDE